MAQRRKQVSGSGGRGWHCHQRVIRFGTLQRPFLLSRLLLSPLRVQGTSDDRNLRVYLVFFTEKEKNRGPRRLSGCPEVARPVGREFCIGRPDGKSRVVAQRRCHRTWCHHTWRLAVLPFLHALDLGQRPPCLPARHLADARGRTSLQGPEPLGTLVVHCLPHHEMVDSLRIFMVPWRRLAAVAWRKESTSLRHAGGRAASRSQSGGQARVPVLVFIRSFIHSV